MVTAEDIARATGVSRSSVSAVLSGQAKKRRIGKETVQHILATAEKMGYLPNVAARNLRKGRSESIGILLPAPKDNIYAGLISELNTYFTRAGYFSAFAFWETPGQQKKATESILCRQPEGIITVEPSHLPNNITIPVVTLFNRDSRFDYVTFDRIGIIKETLHYLTKQGHTRIANPSVSMNPSKEHSSVMQYCYNTLKQQKLTTEYLTDFLIDDKPSPLRNDEKTAISLVEWILSIPPNKRPTALILYRDMTAAYVIREFMKHDIRVPDNISIISCDNAPFTNALTPSLTTFGDHPEDPLFIRLAERILTRINNPHNIKREEYMVKRKLFIRESCRPYTGKEWC